MAEEPQEGGAPVDVNCPNCDEVAPGLFCNTDYGVLHCGCFYEKDASAVCFHISSMCSDKNRSEWEDYK